MQLERGLYSEPSPKQNHTFYLINKLSGEILATYESNPAFSSKINDVLSICPDFWDDDNYELTTKPSEVIL